MAVVDMSVSLKASAGKVWDLIGSFDALPAWHPAVATSEPASAGGRRQRRLGLKGGGEIVEGLERHDDKARLYAYTIDSGPLPVSGYRSELSVREAGPNACTVHWSSRFEPAGAPEAAAVDVVRGVYQAGFDALKQRFGG
jgi:hypothetical protein